MRFGRRLAAEAFTDWQQFYLDYASLKRDVNECRDAHQAAGQNPALQRVLDARKAIFQGCLDAEVLKVLGFYRERAKELLQAVDQASANARELLDPEQQRLLRHSAEKAAALDTQMETLQDLIQETTQLLQYVALNMTAIRKILKKYAKNVDTTNEPLAGYVALEIEHPNDPGWRVLQGTYLPAAVAEDLHAMQEHQELHSAMSQLQQLFEEAREFRNGLLARASLPIPSQGERRLGSIAAHVEEMVAAEAEAARETSLVHAVPWVERAAGMFEPPPPDQFAVATPVGLMLNNLSTLLFMANYTAVLPPTDALCIRIGVSSSYTGLIMASSDLAAIFASLGISFWTQRSFREPLLFSSVACLSGNLLFVASFQWRSLAALLLARLLNGLGSARTANRRYTADYVSRAKRTMASAAFVGASNLGMALGPLMSLPLAYLPEKEVAGLPVNHVTAVGWIMALAWLAFFGATLLLFKDPPKKLPIGLARTSMLLPTDGADSERCKGSELMQPLLEDGSRAEATDVEQPAQAAEPAAVTGAVSSSDVLPHAQRAQQQEAAMSRDKPAAKAAWRATIPATLACTLALFVQKMVQQGYMDSLPIFTEILYSWHSSQKGLFLGLLSAAMVPVNFAVGAASVRLSDRSMVFGSLAVCVAALLALTLSAASAMAFFGGGVLLFTASVVLEGTATSLMSKVIWRGFAQGVLNAGLLSTEAGTLGRFAGNSLLWATGKLTGLGDQQLPRFAHVLFSTLAVGCTALLLNLVFQYKRLQG